MEKTIHIDGRDVPFKSTGAIPMRYKAQFGDDFFAAMLKVGEALKKDEEGNIQASTMDLEVFYNIAWTMAKTADKSIPAPLDWLDSFEEFPIAEVFTELEDLIEHTIHGKKK